MYDPVAGTFTTLAGRLTSARFFHAASALAGGRVLISGGLAGQSFDDFRVLDTAEFYDPTSGTFAAVPAVMTTARAAHTATLLPRAVTRRARRGRERLGVGIPSPSP